MPGPSTCPHSINHQNVPKYIFMSQICFLNSLTRLWLKFDYKVQSFRFLHLPQPTCPDPHPLRARENCPCGPESRHRVRKAATTGLAEDAMCTSMYISWYQACHDLRNKSLCLLCLQNVWDTFDMQRSSKHEGNIWEFNTNNNKSLLKVNGRYITAFFDFKV